MSKDTKLYNIFFNQCHRCQKEHFIAVNHAYSLKRFDEMNPQCACYDKGYGREPSYYTGAMYVS